MRAIAEYDYTRRPDAKRLGAEADDPVLHGPEHGRLLRRRGVEGGARKTGPSPLAADLVPVRGLVLHTGNGELPRQSNQSTLHRVAESEAGINIPFCFEYELRARHPKGVLARLRPYTSYYWSPAPGDDQPPFPTTLFVVDREDVEATFVSTAARMTRMSLPILVSCIPALSSTGIFGRSWHSLWEPESPRLPLSALRAYQ